MALDPGKKITQYSVKSWDMESGLPGNYVFAIRQTRNGYLWIGTQDGLVRFDGVDFELFDQRKVTQLKDDEIRALYEDRQGNLWIGTHSGGLTCYKDGKFSSYPITKYKTLKRISTINEDRRGNLWIGSFTEGITLFKNGEFTNYKAGHGLPHNKVYSILKDKKENLWVAAEGGIVKIVKPEDFQPYPLPEILSKHITACLYKEETKELWAGTGDSYLFRLKDGRATTYGAEAGLSHNTINCLFEDRDKNFWIGTDGGGLVRLQDGVVDAFPEGDKLASGAVSFIYEDREDSLWVGILDKGLFQLRDNKFTTYTHRENLAHDSINCVYEDRDGDLLIGTQAGLNRLTNGEITTVLTTGKGLINNNVLSLCRDRAGYLWIGTAAGLHRFRDGKLTTYTKKEGLSNDIILCLFADSRGDTWIGTQEGLNHFNSSNGTFTVFTTEQGLSDNHIEFIFEDSRGTLLVGTAAGLNSLKDGVFTALNQPVFRDKWFKCYYEDMEGTLYFGSESGFMRLKGEKTTLYTMQNGLIGNHVYAILEDDSGYLWLGGRKGISRISKKELEDVARGEIDRIQPDSYNEEDGLKSRWCTNTGCRTQDGNFWFPTTVGVAMIDPGSIKESKAVPSIIISKLIVDDEPVNIPGRGGKKKPLRLTPGKKRLEFYYTAVSFINPDRIKYKLRLAGYDKDWVNMGKIRSTTYTGLQPGSYTFRVTASSPEGGWSKEGTPLSFYLQPYFTQTAWFYILVFLLVLLAAFSLYRFRVRQLRIREKELGTLVELRTKDLADRNLELEQAQEKIRRSKDLIEAKNRQLEEQSEKLKEMDKVKSRFFANISHEFRTPLTLIMGPLEQMLSDSSDEKQEKKLNLMLRNSQRLLGLINQLLELSKFESGKVKMRASRHNIITFLKGIVANFESLADQSELDLVFNADEENITIYIDREKLEDVIGNLLINAIKFTPPGGRITVTARRSHEEKETAHQPSLSPKESENKQKFFGGISDKSRSEIRVDALRPPYFGGDFSKKPPGRRRQDYPVEISVSDTGPGIGREQLAHIFDRFYQAGGIHEGKGKSSGIGLALVKELVQLFHGKIDVYSREGKGTEFVITLPSGDAHLEADEIVKDGVPDIGSPNENKQKFCGDPGGGFLKEPPGRRRQEKEIDFQKAGKEIILVVEDSADMRDYIRGALEPDYTIVEAGDGKEGIKKAQEIIPDLIISDIMMPEVDGYELCNILKKDIKTSHIPVILLTARASEENIVRGLQTGADDYITKPFSTNILLARIKNLIDLRRQLQLNINREMTLQPAAMEVAPIDKEFIKELKEVINKNLANPEFNVELMAKKLYMDRSTIYRKVLALTGETPTDFIRSCRLKRGAELLKNNFGTVLEVALEVGFSSANYFSKCFKKKFHQLPSTFQAAENPESGSS